MEIALCGFSDHANRLFVTWQGLRQSKPERPNTNGTHRDLNKTLFPVLGVFEAILVTFKLFRGFATVRPVHDRSS